MAGMFKDIGKSSKKILSDGMDTHRKFSFEKADVGFPLLDGQKFTSATTDSSKGLASELTLEGTVSTGVKMKNTANAALSSYSTEVTLDMNKLAGVEGLKVIASVNHKQAATVKTEYTSSLAAVSLAADPANAAAAAYSVGLKPMPDLGLQIGFSGKGAAPPSALALSYDQDSFGAFVGLAGSGYSAVTARGMYTGLKDIDLAAQVVLDGGAYKGATVGGKYKLDGSTTVKVVTDTKSLKSGLEKKLATGVTLTVGHAVDAAKIADTSAHTLGWTLEIK